MKQQIAKYPKSNDLELFKYSQILKVNITKKNVLLLRGMFKNCRDSGLPTSNNKTITK